jgi:hypothetical protein
MAALESLSPGGEGAALIGTDGGGDAKRKPRPPSGRGCDVA